MECSERNYMPLNPFVKGIKFQRNYGKSAALNEGFKMAKGDVVITMDADLQDSPDEIPELRRMVLEEDYDIVSGWKKKRYDSTLSKNIPSKFFNAATRRASGIYLHDFNCGLKAYKTQSSKKHRSVWRNAPLYSIDCKMVGLQKIWGKSSGTPSP